MESLLVIFLATVAIATTLNLILKRFDIPTIVGYIFTGIIIVRLFDIKADKDLKVEKRFAPKGSNILNSKIIYKYLRLIITKFEREIYFV